MPIFITYWWAEALQAQAHGRSLEAWATDVERHAAEKDFLASV
jgi:hypothetical protein